ncbi:ATP-binding protein [Chloroflexota bacterium]
MNRSSIHWRLPISYAGIALLTAVVLGSILLATLRNFYVQQERSYLTNSATLMSSGISKLIEEDPFSPSLDLYLQNLSFLVQARIQLLDQNDKVVADSGDLQTQQFIYTNLTPSGMSAEVLREGKADRYLYYVGINIIEDRPHIGDFDAAAVYLSQLPTENTLCGFGLGNENSKSLQHSDQVVRLVLVGSAGQHLGTLIISEGLAFGGKIINSVAIAWAWASLVAVCVAAGAGWWVSRRMVSPLADLTLATQKMADGQLSARAHVTTKDEFGILGLSFNMMADRVEQMVATLRSFIADAAHELHTPLTTLRVNLDLAGDDTANLDDYLPTAQAQALRMQSLVDSLLDLSRIEANSADQSWFSLSELLEECAGKFNLLADQAGISFDIQLGAEKIDYYGDNSQIRRVFENILDNALKFTRPDGVITVTLKRDERGVKIYVQDSGVGIPPQDLPNLFQRFHRGRNVVSYPGSGLGLAIVKTIIDRHEGEIAVESDGSGTEVQIRLPAIRSRGGH